MWELLSVNLQNLCTIMVFYTALLLIREFPSQQMKCCNGLMIMESLALPCSPTSCNNWLWQNSVILLKTQLQGQIMGNNLPGLSKVLWEYILWISLCFSHTQDSQIQKSKSRNEVASLTITPSNLSEKFLLPILCSDVLEILIPKGRMLPSGNTIIIPSNWELRMPLDYFGLLIPMNQQANKGCAGWVTNPDYQREIGMLLCNGNKECTLSGL